MLGRFYNPDNSINWIEVRKEFSSLRKQAREKAKLECCAICGKEVSSFCNSHSVPRFVLNNIATDGKVLVSNAVIEHNILDIESGIKSTGTFRFICNDCDSIIFSTYENPQIISKGINDQILAEIALKNALVQLAKRNEEYAFYHLVEEKYDTFSNIDQLYLTQLLDIKDFDYEKRRYLHIIENNLTDCFQIIFYKVLPYVTPLAFQSGMSLGRDYYGFEIDDLFDMSPDKRIESLHTCVFPLADCSLVLMFYHKEDHNYDVLQSQLKLLTDEEVLEYINYLIFQNTDSYYFSRSVESSLNNPKLKELALESEGLPNLGFINSGDIIQNYQLVDKKDIPNFLNIDFALKRGG